jgi:hypothetical protein
MLNLNARNKSGKSSNTEDYYAVLIQLNYDQHINEMSKTFFSGLYFELTINFGFNFIDRVFYRVDTKESISNLLGAAIKVIMIQQRLTKEEIQQIVKHAFIIPLQEFSDVKKEILK